MVAARAHHQPSLFGGGLPGLDPAGLRAIRRLALDDTAWVDHLPGWVTGHQALFEALVRTTTWRHERRQMYERLVDVPRLVAGFPADGPGHPILAHIRSVLDAHYATAFERVSAAYYRDGRDSVAWHGDTTARDLPEAVVATVSLGAPRCFLLRPREGGPARVFALGWGDLLVMGGACQRTWRHAIPKVVHAGPRLAVMFRPIWSSPARVDDLRSGEQLASMATKSEKKTGKDQRSRWEGDAVEERPGDEAERAADRAEGSAPVRADVESRRSHHPSSDEQPQVPKRGEAADTEEEDIEAVSEEHAARRDAGERPPRGKL